MSFPAPSVETRSAQLQEAAKYKAEEKPSRSANSAAFNQLIAGFQQGQPKPIEPRPAPNRVVTKAPPAKEEQKASSDEPSPFFGSRILTSIKSIILGKSSSK